MNLMQNQESLLWTDLESRWRAVFHIAYAVSRLSCTTVIWTSVCLPLLLSYLIIVYYLPVIGIKLFCEVKCTKWLVIKSRIWKTDGRLNKPFSWFGGNLKTEKSPLDLEFSRLLAWRKYFWGFGEGLDLHCERWRIM